MSAESPALTLCPPRAESPRRDPAAPPRVWAILEERAGDDAQIRNLAGALGWPVEFKRPLYTLPEVFRHRLTGSVRRSEAQPDVFAPPWPDLVLTIGGRSVVAARRIKDATSGHTKLVCLGRPWAPLDWFDLVVTTPQYRLPDRSNVLQNTLPFNVPPAVDPSADAVQWRARLTELPAPRITVLVGGNNGTYTFDTSTAQDLARRAAQLARELGGSLLVVTSPRTPPAAAVALRDALAATNLCYLWHEHRGHGNPYAEFLAAADHVIVTGDSASMLAEACGAPGQVHLYDLPESPRTRWLNRLFPLPRHERETATLTQALTARGLWFPRRDLSRIHDRLIAAGSVNRLGEQNPTARNVSELAVTVRRIRELVTRPEEAPANGDIEQLPHRP